MTGRASTSSFHYHFSYDVFLNFRGEDTRLGFTGNLYHALTQKGVSTFFDDEEIRKGDEIAPTLLKAVEESRMAIIVFSKNYASSIFCLNELVKIHQFIKRKGRPVWPIFYDVEPSDVRHQRGNYEQALVMHKQNLRADEDKIQSWKLALHEIADICGLHFNPRVDYEYRFIERIVRDICNKINRLPLHVAEYPVGLDSRLQKINSLLQVVLIEDVIMIGICGIGGMGKTTIAYAVYNSIADNFEGLCFLQDIKEKSRKHGLEQMQERMLSKILGVEIKIEDVNEGVTIIKKRLKQKKILLILDNVDKQEQLEKLAGHCDWFGLGSRIIITTRDKHLLVRHGVERKYDMEALDDEESFKLLSWNAFKSNQIDSGYKDILNQVICYTQGLPLALEVIGSHLCGMNKSAWESELDVYKRIPNEKIHQILKVSYDGLTQVEKEIFLDIACFFKGRKLEYVLTMVKHVHGFDPNNGIEVLVDKCLIKIEDDHIEMHDLIQDMGREVIRQESPNEPGGRSRLWFHEDIVHVLEENTGTNKVSIIISDDLSECIEVNWDGEALKNMKGLKILIFENLKFSKGPKYLPNSLKVLKWREYPLSSLPLNFCPKKLAVFDVRHGCFNLMETLQKMENLSVLNFQDCEYITNIPNLSGLSNLKELCVRLCKNLIEIDDSVGKLAKLEILDAMDCAELKNFPCYVKLPSLKELKLNFCSSLKYFPEILGKLEIRHLHLIGTGIEKLPSSICNLIELSDIHIKPTSGQLIELPSNIFLLPKLHMFEVESCGKLPMEEVKSMLCPNIDKLLLRRCNISDEILQIYLISFKNVRQLDLTANEFTSLPECIKECCFLWILTLKDCKNLREVEGIPPNLKRLNARGCVSLSSKSRELLLSEELLADVVINDISDIAINAQTYFRVPGVSIPKWLDHRSEGASISFWFRNSFPTLCVCALLRQPINNFPEDASAMVFINFESVLVHNLWHGSEVSEEDHILVYDLKRDYLHDDGVKQVFKEGEWNHVEVCIYSYTFPEEAVKESGIYVIKQHFDMEDIRFINPLGSLDFIGGAQGRRDSGTGMKEKERILKKKRPLMKDDDVASCSISLRCTKWRMGTTSQTQRSSETNSADVSEFSIGDWMRGSGLQGSNIDIGSDWLSLRPCWETTLDDNYDVNKASLPLLPCTKHAGDNFSNQDHDIEDNNWLSLRPCWETPSYDESIHQEFQPTQHLTFFNVGETSQTLGDTRNSNNMNKK